MKTPCAESGAPGAENESVSAEKYLRFLVGNFLFVEQKIIKKISA